LRDELAAAIEPVGDLAAAVAASDIVITCTTSQRFFITRGMVQPGTFVAGVGADSEHKQELDPALLAHCTVVADLLDQCCAIGDLHHAIEANAMRQSDVHASQPRLPSIAVPLGRRSARVLRSTPEIRGRSPELSAARSIEESPIRGERDLSTVPIAPLDVLRKSS